MMEQTVNVLIVVIKPIHLRKAQRPPWCDLDNVTARRKPTVLTSGCENKVYSTSD